MRGRDYLDRLSVLRNQVFVLDHMYVSLLGTIGWLVRVAITLGLLASIDPLLLLLAVFAVPTVITSSWRPAVERQVEESYAAHSRLADHLFATATTAASGEGGPGHRHRAGPGGSAPDRMAALVRPGRARTVDHRPVPFGRLGLLRARLRRRGRLRCRRPPGRRRLGAADPGGRCPPRVLRRRHHRRDRIPPRRLAGRLAAAGLARGLRRGGRCPGRPRRARSDRRARSGSRG